MNWEMNDFGESSWQFLLSNFIGKFLFVSLKTFLTIDSTDGKQWERDSFSRTVEQKNNLWGDLGSGLIFLGIGSLFSGNAQNIR
ncbi:hypothetical protein [Enterococcus sp. C76]|uniref:hypothetical protein n=1 Tax=Enterococcus sp. C76 TaxID=3231334 RepID=UPI0034A040A3